MSTCLTAIHFTSESQIICRIWAFASTHLRLDTCRIILDLIAFSADSRGMAQVNKLLISHRTHIRAPLHCGHTSLTPLLINSSLVCVSYTTKDALVLHYQRRTRRIGFWVSINGFMYRMRILALLAWEYCALSYCALSYSGVGRINTVLNAKN